MKFEALKQTPIYDCLSETGQRIFQPNGIFYWSTRAKNEAKINATIGTAFGPETDLIPEGRTKNIPYYLPTIKSYINLDPERLTAYAPVAGVPKFRKKWKEWIIYKGQYAKNMPSGARNIEQYLTMPIVCNGITNAIYITSRLFLNPKEKIICPNKRWGNYNLVLKQQNELDLVFFKHFADQDFNLKDLMDKINEVALTQNHIVLILNFPHNPTGYCPTTQEMHKITQNLINFAETSQKPIVVLCDDAYEGYVYVNGRATNSIFYELVNRHPLLLPVKLDGTSKEMLMYGGRIASITLGLHQNWLDKVDSPQLQAEWENKLQGMIRSTISNANHFIQEMMLEVLQPGFEKLLETRKKTEDILFKRYHATMEAYQTHHAPETSLDPAGGGFFVFMNIHGIPADKLGDHLLTKYQVGTFPMVDETLNINGLRIAYCSILEKDIEETMESVKKAVEDLRSI